MSMTFPLFVGSPCGQHGPYTFYKAFKYQKNGKLKILTLGEFFFVRINPNEDPCIGELQLLWEDRNRDQVLSSMRLYFLPEQTPDGRMSQHGDHEVLAASGKVILKLADLVEWIMDSEEVDWSYGLCAGCEGDITAPVPDVGLPPQSLKETKNLPEGVSKDLAKVFSDNNCGFDTKDINKEKEMIGDQINPYIPKVVVVSYPRYCRYRSMLKRLEGTSDHWHKNALVIALGGFTLSGYNTFILFCRDTFDHEALLHNDLNCDHLAPNLKGRPRKRHVKIKRSTSPDSESNTSEENREVNTQKMHLKNGLKKPACKDEQEFLQRLFKFMKDRNTPIHRIPHLGFKQIDLYFFFMYTQKLGGYERITYKKLWKHVYDELGGNPGSTSAATCTRRHYERLLLPFERFISGENIMDLPPPPPPSHLRIKREKPELKQDENGDNVLRTNNQIEENCDSTDGSQEDRHEQDERTTEAAQNGDIHKRDIKREVKDLECYEKDWKDVHRNLLPSKVVANDNVVEDNYSWNEMKKKNLTNSWVSSSSKRSLSSKHQKFQEQENKPPLSMASSGNLSCNNSTNIMDCMSQMKPATSPFIGAPYAAKSENKEFLLPTHNNEASLSNFVNTEGNQKQCCVTRTGHLPVRDGRINSQRSLPVSIASSNKNNLPSLPVTNLGAKSMNSTVSPHQVTSTSRSSSCASEGKMEIKLEHCSSADARHQSSVSIMSPLLYRKSQAASHSSSSAMLPSIRSGRPVMPHISPYNITAKPVPPEFAVSRMSMADSVHKNHVENTTKEAKLSQRRPSVIQHTEHVQSSPPPHVALHSSAGVSCNSSYSPCSGDVKGSYSLPKDRETMGRSTELVIPRVTFNDVRPCMPPDALAKSPRITHQTTESKVQHGHLSYRNCEIPVNRTHNTMANNTNPLSITMHPEPPYKQSRHPLNSPVRTDAYFHSSSKNPDYKQKSPPVAPVKRAAPCYEQNKRLKLRSSPPLPGVPITTVSSSHNHNYYSSPPSFFQCPSTKTVNCDDEVLDLSVKKKPQPVVEENISRIVPVSPVLMTDVMVDGECLDLSVKKNIVMTNSAVVENTDLLSGIEDITPPPPPCTPPEYQNSSFVAPPIINNAHPPRVDNLKLSTDIQCNRLKQIEPMMENHSSVHQNHMKSVSPASDISTAQSPLLYKLRGAAKAVSVTDYNPRLPSFIAPSFYHFNPTSWTSPHYSAASGIPAYKEMTEQNPVAEPQQRGMSHLYPFMYNNGCVYQAYTK